MYKHHEESLQIMTDGEWQGGIIDMGSYIIKCCSLWKIFPDQ